MSFGLKACLTRAPHRVPGNLDHCGGNIDRGPFRLYCQDIDFDGLSL